MKTNKNTTIQDAVKEKIKSIRKSAFLDSPPAIVEVNGPRALIQCNGEGQLQGIAWVLSQPLYKNAKEILLAAVTIRNTAELLANGLHGKNAAFGKAWQEVADHLTPIIDRSEGK